MIGLDGTGVSPDWAAALRPVAGDLDMMADFLAGEAAAGRGFLPAASQVLRAFSMPLADVRVLVLGQDPYPTPGHPVGLAFSVARTVQPLPRSLQNIYTELQDDLGVPPAPTGDLTGWFDSGVLLLNRVLSVQPGRPGSHAGKGWEQITAAAVTALANRGGPLVAVLWGRSAQQLAPLLGPVPCVRSPHPSPLSARTGFFGSRPFSRTNALLRRAGAEPIDWSRHLG